MKKLIGLGTIIASIAPTLLVVACGSDNGSDNVTQKKNNYQPLAVGVELRHLSDEDLIVWSSTVGSDVPQNLKDFRDHVEDHIERDGNKGKVVYNTISQKVYDEILSTGRDILLMKNKRFPPTAGVVEDNVKYAMEEYYDHYKNSSIKNKIDTNDYGFILKWL